MSLAPLIKPIRLEGGTFYTFSSASEDLGLTFSDSQKKFRFSKFALLNIPNVQNSASGGENYVGLSNAPGAFEQIDGSKTLNDYLAESLQNYCLNLEAIITSSPSYDPNIDRTVSERVFYKWLKELGVLRFRQASTGEVSSPSYGIRFVEEDESTKYQRVVRYVGDINILNSTRNNFNAYSEIYIYIPSSHGNTPVVLFNTISDNNYAPNGFYNNNPTNPLDAPFLIGRNANTTHPAGLDIEAFYDSETNNFTVPDPFSATSDFYYYNPNLNSYVIQSAPSGFQWWYSNPVAYSYFLEPSAFGDSTNDKFKIESVNKSVEFTRSRLDGISLDFDTLGYAGIVNNPNITDFGKYNESSQAQTFEFNTVLVYYDLYDPEDSTSFTTNLFGVLFLDNVDPLPGGGGYIPRLKKYKPNSLTGNNGNSYAFKINLKFDINAQDTAVETTINDYNPYSLELYMDALNLLNQSSVKLEENNIALHEQQTKLSEIQNLILTSTSAQELEKKITSLEKTLIDGQAIFSNTQNILSLIERNYQDITNIYNNKTSVNIAYNVDLLVQGPGIILDKSAVNQVKITNDKQQFTLGTKPLISILNDFNVNLTNYSYIKPLELFNNYIKITDGSPNEPLILDRDVIIYVNDSINKWVSGQGLRISFTNGLDLSNTNGNFNLVVYSDALDTLNTGFPYSAEIAFVPYSDFDIRSNKPTIELICIDPKEYKFTIDIF